MKAKARRAAWTPILDGELRERALDAVRAIADTLPAWIASEVREKGSTRDVSLSGGAAGFALLYAYLAKAGVVQNAAERAEEFLHDAIDAVAQRPMEPSLYGGFTGIAWTVAHLRGSIVDLDEDATTAIDEVLRDHLSRKPWRADYDLVSGLVGFGVYGLEQLPSSLAAECVTQIVDRLDETAARTPNGITWFTRPELLPDWQREICPKGYYNLGLAHGVPGVIAFLGRVCTQDRHRLSAATREKARALLDGAVAWLFANKQSDNSAGFFPGWLAPDVERRPGRVAWCYGDLGVAVALLLAARCVRQRKWEQEAIEIAKDVARRTGEQSRVIDPALCHGAAGVAHLFNRLFHATGDRLFKDTARFWFERALEMRREGEGVAGFSAVRVDPERGPYPVAVAGLLEGAAGIGLALLAAITNVEPAWDGMLLVNIPLRVDVDLSR